MWFCFLLIPINCVVCSDVALLAVFVIFRYNVGDWVKFKRSVVTPTNGWQGADHKSVGFVQSTVDNDHLIVSFWSGEVTVLISEITKVIPLNRGQHVRLRRDVRNPRYVSFVI